MSTSTPIVPPQPAGRRRLPPAPRHRPGERLIQFGLLCCGLLSIAVTVAIIAIVGFLTLLFNFVGINFFFGGGSMHSYAG